jgi:Txe/YoeB family toxin of Txe-Axe toxin-antitoxin module
MEDLNYWKHCHQKVQNMCEKLENEIKNIKYDMASKTIKERFNSLKEHANGY